MLLYRLSVQCLLCRQMTECLNSSKTISHHDAKMTSWSINLQRNKDVVRIKNKIGKYLYSLIYELVFCEFYVIFLSNGTSNIGYFCCNISILLVWNISIDVFNKYLKSVFVGNSRVCPPCLPRQPVTPPPKPALPVVHRWKSAVLMVLSTCLPISVN